METVKTYDKVMGMYTTGELIKALEQCPANTPIDFDFAYPGEGEAFEESIYSGVYWRACRVTVLNDPEIHRGACRVGAIRAPGEETRMLIIVAGPIEDPSEDANEDPSV